MRRGLILWSETEVPAAVLDARVARFQKAMAAERLDAAVLHTCFPRPAAVSFLTHFVPYWSEAVLVVMPEGAPCLFAALSKRVHGWIREVSHLGEIISAPKPGDAAAKFLKARAKGGARIGIVDFEALPFIVVEPLAAAFGRDALIAADGTFAAIRQPPDAAEIALAERAFSIATAAMANADPQAKRASEFIPPIEAAARAAGAEEAMIAMAPDLGVSPSLRRIEGDVALGGRFAAQLSLAYKGTWIRTTRSFTRESNPPADWEGAERWFADFVTRLDPKSLSQGHISSPISSAATADWRIEACVGAMPLATAAVGGRPAIHRLPAGSLAVASARLATASGPWLGACPLVLGGDGQPGHTLADQSTA
jgi:hypothetical protein